MKIRIVLIAAMVAFGVYGFTSINEDVNTSEIPQGKGYYIGQIAPEMELTSVDGKKMKLSDFRGKMVLIDFWASWCRPCRMENPHVVAAYNKYKDKSFKNGEGFTVYGVSLDRSKDPWKQAIKDDKLVWKSNMWGNQAVAQQYGVRGIPSSFLLDGDGVIIATNLRGDALKEKLKSLLK